MRMFFFLVDGFTTPRGAQDDAGQQPPPPNQQPRMTIKPRLVTSFHSLLCLTVLGFPSPFLLVGSNWERAVPGSLGIDSVIIRTFCDAGGKTRLTTAH